MAGGSFNPAYSDICWSAALSRSFTGTHPRIVANYLFKALQAWKAKGVAAYAISVQVRRARFYPRKHLLTVTFQNEPENSNPTYPTCLIPAAVEAQIGTTLRGLMDSNGCV